MPNNLMEMVKNYFTPDFINNASSNIGENSSGVSKALTAIIPTGLAAIVNKATSGSGGEADVLEMAKNSVYAATDHSASVSEETKEKGSSLLNRLFGAKQSEIQNSISGFSGLKNSSTSSLISLALPAIMGILGKHAEENNLSASGLAGFLSSQKGNIMQALPPGLSSIPTIAGLDTSDTVPTHLESTVKTPDIPHPHTHDITTISERPTAKWLVPLVTILVVVLLLWYFSRSCGETKPSGAADKDSTSAMQIVLPTGEIWC